MFKDRITEQHKNRVDYMMDCEDLDCPHSKLDWRFYYFVRYLKCSLFSFNLISSSLATKWAFLPSQHIFIFIGNVMLFFQPWQNIRNIVKCVTVVYKATNQCALNNKQNKESRNKKKANHNRLNNFFSLLCLNCNTLASPHVKYRLLLNLLHVFHIKQISVHGKYWQTCFKVDVKH